MKKLLLLASTAIMGVAPVFGQFVSVDPAKYQDEGDYKFYNRWLISRNVSNIDDINNSLFAGQYCRTATIYNDEVLVQFSNADDQAKLYRFDFATGAPKGELLLTLDGEAYGGLLAANTVGVDDYGHLYICGYCADLNKGGLQIYLVNAADGSLTALPAIDPAAEGESADAGAVRVDYIDVIGDLTGAECSATVMAACSAGNLAVLRAIREQGSDVFEGGFDGFYFWEAKDITETYPMITDKDAGTSKPQSSWGTAPLAKMINDEEHVGETFYIDGFNTCPSIYNTQGAMLDSFASCSDLAPNPGTNGVAEFALGSDNFVVWSVCQYDKTPGCTASVGTFGEGFEYKDLKAMWTFPEAGLGNQSDTGTRVHCLQAKKFVDANENEGVYILDYKCMNGLGVYVLAQKDFQDPNELGVEGVEEDLTNAPAEYFNLQGQKIANPENGLYIVKRGNKVTKEMVK
ncbi:MAG: hypothetical protein UH625_07330 [Muribaculaceae bacterium]|nr:hypothetical protein [Muribaculaceae bacterium]